MKIAKDEVFDNSLEKIVLFIAKDSKRNAIKFKSKLQKKLNTLKDFPYKYRKSYYYSDENIRDFIFKGYTIPYLIDEENSVIVILDIFKWIDK